MELLAVLAVLGLVLALLAQGLGFGMRATAAQVRARDAGGGLDVADRAVRQLIQSMDPGTYTVPPHVTGGPSSLAFTADLPAAAQGAERPRADVELRLDGPRLVLSWAPHVHAELFRPGPPARETVLAGDVARLDIDYAAWGGPWVSTWTAPALPALVRVRVAFADGDPRRWPPIVAAPQRERFEE